MHRRVVCCHLWYSSGPFDSLPASLHIKVATHYITILWTPGSNAQLVMVDGTNLECARCPRRCAEKHTFRKKWETAAFAVISRRIAAWNK